MRQGGQMRQMRQFFRGLQVRELSCRPDDDNYSTRPAPKSSLPASMLRSLPVNLYVIAAGRADANFRPKRQKLAIIENGAGCVRHHQRRWGRCLLRPDRLHPRERRAFRGRTMYSSLMLRERLLSDKSCPSVPPALSGAEVYQYSVPVDFSARCPSPSYLYMVEPRRCPCQSHTSQEPRSMMP
jgi:hypothetical protein